MNTVRTLLLIGPAVACSGSEPPPAKAPRDVILVAIDTLRADHTSAYGYPRDTTPNLAALAQTGLRFNRAYAQSSWTLASFSSMFTGLHPHQHGVARDDRDTRRYGRLDPSVPTLASTLKAHGRATVGFVNNTFMAPEFGLQAGFDDYDYHGASSESHRTGGQTVQQALSWLDAHEAPSFVFLHLMEPHLDYLPPIAVKGTFSGPPPPELGPEGLSHSLQFTFQQVQKQPIPSVVDHMVDLYDEEILAADQALGALVAGLKKRDRWAQTLLVVTSDHGEEFYEHGGFEHGRSLFAETTRVPMVAVGPGLSPGVVDTPVSHVDMFQGILAQAGAPAPVGAAGQDMFALAGAPPSRRAVLSENCLYTLPCASLVDQDYRLTVDLARKRAVLWHVGADLAEREMVPEAEMGPLARPMIDELKAIRGSLEVLESRTGPRVPSHDTFELLRTMGYVDDADPSQQTPEQLPPMPGPSKPAKPSPAPPASP